MVELGLPFVGPELPYRQIDGQVVDEFQGVAGCVNRCQQVFLVQLHRVLPAMIQGITVGRRDLPQAVSDLVAVIVVNRHIVERDKSRILVGSLSDDLLIFGSSQFFQRNHGSAQRFAGISALLNRADCAHVPVVDDLHTADRNLFPGLLYLDRPVIEILPVAVHKIFQVGIHPVVAGFQISGGINVTGRDRLFLHIVSPRFKPVVSIIGFDGPSG